jgi:hypothetical protein
MPYRILKEGLSSIWNQTIGFISSKSSSVSRGAETPELFRKLRRSPETLELFPETSKILGYLSYLGKK